MVFEQNDYVSTIRTTFRFVNLFLCAFSSNMNSQKLCSICTEKKTFRRPFYNVACLACSDSELGFVDKLVCAECTKKLKKKCPFCNVPLDENIRVEEYTTTSAAIVNYIKVNKKQCCCKLPTFKYAFWEYGLQFTVINIPYFALSFLLAMLVLCVLLVMFYFR